jgi:hypothetical protein
VCLALIIVAACHLLGTPHSLDMLATAEQKREHMERAVEFLRSKVTTADILFTDRPTSLQLMRYLCGPKPVSVELSGEGFAAFPCNGIQVISTALGEGCLTPQSFPERLREMAHTYNLSPATTIWVVQASWSTGLGEALRDHGQEFARIKPQVFDRYIEVFELPPRLSSPAA